MLAAALALAGSTACSGDDQPASTATPSWGSAAPTPGSPGPPTAQPSPDGAFSGHGTGNPRPSQPTSAPRATAPGATGAAVAVRIDAVELHPEDPMPGGQFVVISNHGRDQVSVDCWVLSTRSGASARVRADAPIAPGGALRLLAEQSLFDSSDAASILDVSGRVVDGTPDLTDTTGDDQLWYRTASGTWAFGRDYRFSSETRDGRLVTDTC